MTPQESTAVPAPYAPTDAAPVPAQLAVDGHAAVAEPACRNCDAPMYGAYCARCGQRESRADPSFRELAADAWDAFTNVDGKLLSALRSLVLRPGELTVEYLAGRRARYLTPLRLYLACSLLFFLVASMTPSEGDYVRISRSGATVSLTPDSAAAGTSDDRAGDPDWVQRMNRGWKRAKSDQQSFASLLRAQVPRVVFLMVPLYALILALAYQNRRRKLPAHMVFALHAHAFVFLAFAIPQAAALVLPGALARWTDAAVGFWLLAYFPFALRRAYGGRWGATLVRTLASATIYFAVATALGVGFILAMAWVFGGTA